jgi:hypothetical protein
LNPSKTTLMRRRIVVPMNSAIDLASATVTIGPMVFSAHIETSIAPESCRALMRLLPYSGRVTHARWSGEAMWSPLRNVWSSAPVLPDEESTDRPLPGQLLLYAGERSEPEILVPYGATRFGCVRGALAGNRILTIVDGLDELARVGLQSLETGAMPLRIEIANPSR